RHPHRRGTPRRPRRGDLSRFRHPLPRPPARLVAAPVTALTTQAAAALRLVAMLPALRPLCARLRRIFATGAAAMTCACIKSTRLIKPDQAGGRSLAINDKNRPKRMMTPAETTGESRRARCAGGDKNKKTAPSVGTVRVGGKIQSAQGPGASPVSIGLVQQESCCRLRDNTTLRVRLRGFHN